MPRRVDKEGKIGSLPVSTDAEMDVSGESSIPKRKECQIRGSCVPVTPMKPVVKRPQRTCVERRQNQLGCQENHEWAQETLPRTVAAYSESLKSIDISKILKIVRQI